MKYINCTPHAINLNDGTVFPPSGTVARVTSSYEEVEPGVYRQTYGNVTDLPAPVVGTRYIVSAIVLAAVGGRADCVAPATGHPEVVRNEKGHIMSVPGFVM